MSEELINLILKLLISDIPKSKKLFVYDDIKEILKYYHNPEIITNDSDKINFLNSLVNKLYKGTSIDSSLTDLLSMEKYKQFSILIRVIGRKEISEDDLSDMIVEIIKHRQYLGLKDQVNTIRSFVENYDDQKFDSVETLINNYNDIVKKLFMDSIVEGASAEGNASVLEPASKDEDLDIIMDDYLKFFDTSGLIPTGYKTLDKVFNGGCERSRVYTLAARPGDGKSTLLLNILYNWALSDYAKKNNGFFLYVTLENLTFETGMRLFCMDQGMDSACIRKMLGSEEGKNHFKKVYKKIHKNMYIAHFQAFNTTMLDIIKYIETIQAKEGKKILGLVTDYIDLFKADRASDMYRIELGNITMEHKMVAARYQIPVLTCTQMKKDAYARQAGMGDLSESSKKVEHSDAILLLKSDKLNHQMIVDLVKSRNSNIGSFVLDYDEKTFRISNCDKVNTESDSKANGSLDLSWDVDNSGDAPTYTDLDTNEKFII